MLACSSDLTRGCEFLERLLPCAAGAGEAEALALGGGRPGKCDNAASKN
jgi:hypothetical protein